MSATGSAVNVGNSGRIRVLINVLSQDVGNNRSRVRVRGQMAKRNEVPAHNDNGVPMRIYGNHGITSRATSTPFSVAGSTWVTVRDEEYWVTHASDGRRTVTANFELGATGTNSFGNGGTASVSLAIDRIARPPAKPGKPSISQITNTGFRSTLSSAPANNGAGIIEYGWEIQNVDSSGTQTTTTSGRTWDTSGRSANTRYRVRVRARNSAGWGTYSDWSNTVTTKVDGPAAPTNVTAARQNDSRINTAWSRNATSDAPYTSQRVQRRHWLGPGDPTDWSNRATLSGTATSWADTGVSANNIYEYRIVAVNATGTGTSSTSGTVRTTPAPPTIGTAKKLSSGDIQVPYTRMSPYSTDIEHELQDNPGGTGWVTIATQLGSEEFIHQDPDAGVSHTYRVRTRSTRAPVLVSDWSVASNTIQLLTPPNPPSLVGPDGVTDRDEPVRLEYRHNPVDTTDQTAGQIRWRPAGGSWVTVNTGTDAFYELPAPGSSGTFEWQARTKGAHADWSSWSPTWSFDAVSRPEVVIQSPETELDQSQVEVVWGYQNADASPQSRWEVQLLDGAENVLATGQGTGVAGSYLFSTILDDATTYTVRVRARAGTGLWSQWDTATFVTDFPLPYPVEVMAEWDTDTGSVSITFDVDDSDSNETVPETVDVQRDDGDGWITIAVDLDPETSIVDYTPRLGEVRYRTVSRTDLPTARLGPVTILEWEHTGRDPIYVNGGTDFADVRTAIGHEVTDTPGIEQAAQEWAGWDKPTAVFGEGQRYAVQFQGKIFPHMPGLDGRSIREEWHDLLLKRGVVCYRDCAGRKIFGLMNVGFQTASSVTNLSLTVDETHHVEGVRDVLPVPDGGGD